MATNNNLKPREIEILCLMADDLTNREIAARLYIGVETVRWYAKQIYGKLAVSGREEAAEKAQRLGLLDDHTSIEESPETKPNHNLPLPLTSFIGREQQIAEIMKLLEEIRLLTLIGPGGTGKTRLSLKIAENVVDHFPNEVYFIDLTPVSERTMVVSAIAYALGIVETTDKPIIEILKQAIGNRTLLLLLDNFEHVIESASLVTDLLSTVTNRLSHVVDLLSRATDQHT